MEKHLLLLGAGLEQTIMIHLAHDMGIKVIALDGNPDAVGLKEADVGLHVDIKNIDEVVKIGKDYQVNGVVSHGVEIPVITSTVAEKLRLPGLSPKVAELATDKIKRIEFFSRNGINCPRFNVVSTVDDAKKAGDYLGYPCVFKPIDSSGARGVRIVDSESVFREAFEEGRNHSMKSMYLIEEKLEGREISTESIVYQDKIITTGFADRNYNRNLEFYPFFVEDGHTVPSSIKGELKRNIIDTINNTIRKMGINWGVAKGDILVDKNGKIFVIEMAARSSGGWFAAGTVPLATGVNILKTLIYLSLNYPIDEASLKPKYSKSACQRYIIPTKAGRFRSITGLETARSMPGVKMLETFNIPKEGTEIRKSKDHTERYGQLIAVGNTIPEATQKCENAVNKIKINYF